MPTIHNGDCIETMNAMPPESIDAIVCDPPYGLGFMGKKWDGLPPSLEWAEACYRVLKPGGHIAAFGGTRTWHRLAVAIEDAGFEMRDSLAWLYGSGFPKSHDVSKGIDKMNGEAGRLHKFTAWMRTTGITARQLNEATGTNMGGHYLTAASQPAIPTPDLWAKIRPLVGEVPDWVDELVERIEAEREVVGVARGAMSGWSMDGGTKFVDRPITKASTPDAVKWSGWGTALKPAFEPIVLARKPFKGTVAGNVLAHGTGAINVDACRIETDDDIAKKYPNGPGGSTFGGGAMALTGQWRQPSGRWPANVLLDQHAAGWVDEQSGFTQSPSTVTRGGNRQEAYGMGRQENVPAPGDSGGASRFFYSAKAPKSERPNVDGVQHPTVKPLAIMRWLIRLVTPPGGTVLDPFAGSGTTIEAALIEGFNPIGIEMETDYLPLIQHRIDRATPQPTHASETA